MNTNKSKNSKVQKDAIKWLILLESPSVSESEKQTFFKWLKTDVDHQKAYIRAEKLWIRGGGLLQLAERNPTRHARRMAIPILSTVAACMVIFIISMGVGLFESTTEYSTRLGEQKVITLPDNSRITLNTNSLLETDVSGRISRKVLLTKGEVFFDVSRNPKKPFSITTEDGKIVVLGTKFSVYKKEDKTIVTVLEGSVRIAPKSSFSDKAEATILSSNQQAEINAEKVLSGSVNAEKSLSWRSQELYFDGVDLSEVVEELNRYYPTKIELADTTLNHRLVIAVISLEKSFENNLSFLKKSLSLESTVNPDGSIVVLQPK